MTNHLHDHLISLAGDKLIVGIESELPGRKDTAEVA